MTKLLAAAGVLAISGSALASTFSIIGLQVVGEEASGFAQGDFIGGLLNNGIAVDAGTFGPPFGSFAIADAPTSTLIGPNFGGAPALDGSETPDWVAHLDNTPQIGIEPLTTNPTDGIDSAFSWNYVAAQNATISGELLWIGQFFTGDGSDVDSLSVRLFTVPATLNTPAGGPTLSLDNPIGFDPTSGFELELIQDGNNVFIQVVPSPGAAALLGLAGVAGIRRRRA